MFDETQVTPESPPADERSLIEAAQQDPRRFGALYEAHFERVYAYVVRRVRDRHAAEDITSEVFQQALANLGRFEWRGVPFAAWLVRIAKNAIVDRGRRAAREVLVADPGERADEAPDPELEHHARLYRLVRALPEDQRRVIELRFVEQRSIREVAAQLGRSEGAVKQLQFRAIDRLRARMGEDHA